MITHEENEKILKRDFETVNALRESIGEVPEWAEQIREAMPDWGFEIHCMRWLDGLDALLYAIRDATYYRNFFGTYDDCPGYLLDGIEQKAVAVQRWLDKKPLPEDAFTHYVYQILGEHTPQKDEAACCFVELTQAFVEDQDPNGQVKQLGKIWRTKTSGNGILKYMFTGDGLDHGLFSGGSYWTLHRLNVILRLIGGDAAEIQDITGTGNYELRNVLRDAPLRLNVTLGYLWGIHAYLHGYTAEWLRAEKPTWAGAAIAARNQLAKSDAAPEIVRWLASVLFVTTRFWYQRALVFASQKQNVPARFLDIPSFDIA
ncbi:MAG: hypothetical protein ACOYYS_04925 [Chloroflexota bacterium]